MLKHTVILSLISALPATLEGYCAYAQTQDNLNQQERNDELNSLKAILNEKSKIFPDYKTETTLLEAKQLLQAKNPSLTPCEVDRELLNAISKLMGKGLLKIEEQSLVSDVRSR